MTVKRLFCLLAALLLLAASASAEVYFNGDESVPQIAVTVDDCYNMEVVTGFLDLAAEHGFKLTFFPIGRAVRTKDAGIWRRIVTDGHEIGNHTNSHDTLTILDEWGIECELTVMQKKINSVLGFDYPFRLMRPPGGHYNGRVKRKAEELGYDVIMWSAEIQNAKEKEIECVKKLLDNGLILLLHTNAYDLRMLEALLPTIEGKGLVMVTVSELIGRDAPDKSE